MAGLIDDSQLQTFAGFPRGINNTAREEDVPRDAVRDALNVDFTADGKPRRRQGRTKVLDLPGLHSVWGCPEHPTLLGRLGDDLIAIDPHAGYATRVLASGLGLEEASYCELNGEVLWTVEDRASGRLDALQVNRPLGLPTPGMPALSLSTNGGLPAGVYQVSLTFRDAFGEDSGAPRASTISVPANGAIVVALPPAPAAAVETCVWVSEPDGTALYHAIATDADTPSLTLRDTPRGDELQTQHLSPLPAGQIVREVNGIVLMALGNVLYHGEAMRPRLGRLARNFIPFADRIDMLQPVGEGTAAGWFVGAGSRTYFLSGATPLQASIRFARVAGAVPGTGLSIPGELAGYPQFAQVAYWMGRDGSPCLGFPGGEVKVLAKDTAMTRFARGASLARELNGIRSLLTAGPQGPIASMAATDKAEVFHYRNGIPVP